MFYAIRVNAAIAALGVDPRSVPLDLRQQAQEMGKRSGCTPQETALMLISQLPLYIHSAADIRVANLWVRERKVRRENPAIYEAMMNLGWNL
jgi:hypothetical protein